MSNSTDTMNLDGLNPHPSLDFNNIYTDDFDRQIRNYDETIVFDEKEFIKRYVLPSKFEGSV